MSGYFIPDDMRFLAEGHPTDANDMCKSEWGDDLMRFVCTRWAGHDGNHEAGIGNGEPVSAVWDDAAADGAA